MKKYTAMILFVVILCLFAGCKEADKKEVNTSTDAQATTQEEQTCGAAEENTSKSEAETTTVSGTENATTTSTEQEVEPTAETPTTTAEVTTTKNPEAVSTTTKKSTEENKTDAVVSTTKKQEVTTTKKQETSTTKKTETATTTKKTEGETTTKKKGITAGTNEQKLWILDGINQAREDSGCWLVPRQLDPFLTAQAQAYAEELAKANEGHAVHSEAGVWSAEGVSVNWINLEAYADKEEPWFEHGEVMCLHVGGMIKQLYYGIGIAAAEDGTTYTVVQGANYIGMCFCEHCEDGNYDLCEHWAKYSVRGTYDEWRDGYMETEGLYFQGINSAQEYVWAGYPYIDIWEGVKSTTDFIK